MSIVSTVVVVHSEIDDGEVKRHIEAFAGTSQGAMPAMKQLDPCEDVGGYKCAECEVLVGAFNHVDVDGFIRHLEQYQWRYPAEAAVIINTSSPCDVTVVWRPPQRQPDGTLRPWPG